MCYSKEVSLAVAGMVASGVSYSWWTFVRAKVSSTLQKLQPCYKYVLLGLVFLGGHQAFEFLAILTGSQIVYKTGLLISITIMYWLMRSLEALSGFRLGGRVFMVIIALLGVQMFLKDMTFENEHFWVRGDSHAIWGATWLALYFYWNVCIFYLSRVSKSKTNSKLLHWYGFLVLNVSFLASLVYGYTALIFQKTCTESCGSDVLSSFHALQDLPSIWCVIAGMHVFLLPILFKRMNAHYEPKAGFKVKKIPFVKLILATTVIWGVLFLLNLEVLFGVSVKMITH